MPSYFVFGDFCKTSPFGLFTDKNLPQKGVITIEQYFENKNIKYEWMILLLDPEFMGEKPIVYSKEKAIMLLTRFPITMNFYIHPSVMDKEFMTWVGENRPMDILQIPLELAENEDAVIEGLQIALQQLKNYDEYDELWFKSISEGIPAKFKDRVRID